jgi:hypothetical protein
MHGDATSINEVTNITAHGFWLLVDDRELFVPLNDYPVFRTATLTQIFNVQRIGPMQFHWPDLDADIELDALEKPESFPLRFKPASA